MPLNSWDEIFRPTFRVAGLDLLTANVSSRLFDDFESYATDAAIQAIWTETGGAGNPVLTTAANAIRGQQSMQVPVAGAVGTIYRTIDQNFFHGPAGRRIRYVRFKGVVSAGGTSSTIRVRLSDASDATMFREWQFTVAVNKTQDFIIDLYSGSTGALTGGGYLNTESRSGPIAEGATAWNPALIDRFEFRVLADGLTYRFDDIRFFYEYSALDAIGFGTEPATDDGADGSVQSKLRYLANLTNQLVGTTEQYSKTQPHTAYLNNTYTFGLELIGIAEQGIPSAVEITPGNYTIDRVRSGTTTNIVASTAATEAAGFISVSYTPLEDNWQPGDQILVTFSGGLVDNDTDTAVTPTANIGIGATTVQLANAALFQVNQRVRIYDDVTPNGERFTVSSIDSPTQITISGATVAAFTAANNFHIVLIERTTLETARLITNVTYEPELNKDLLRWVLADYDDFDFADADGNTERWDVGYIANSDGSAAGTEGGSANINTTTAGQARVAVDPDITPTQAAYALKRDEPSRSRYFSTVVDLDAALDASQATSTFAGLRISAGDVDDPANYVLVAREHSTTVDRITARAEFAGVVQTTVNFSTGDNAVSLKIERYGNVWNIFYSLTQFPNHNWVKLTQFEDAAGDMTGVTSIYLYSESGGTVDAQTAFADFDNWRYYIGSGAIDQLLGVTILAEGTFTTSSATVPADTGRTEENNFWNGTLLMPITGVVAYQPRTVVSFANAGGVFTMDPEAAYTSAPAVGDQYVILAYQYPLEPSTDATSNSASAHVVGSKLDTAQYNGTNTASSIVRLLRAVHRGEILATGTLTTDSATVPADTGRAEANDYWNGSWLMTVSGAVAFQPRLIADFANAGGVFTLDAQQPFTAVPGLVVYVILAPNSQLVPAANAATNTTPAHVVGNKADTTVPTPSATASLAGYVKALVARGMGVIQGTVTSEEAGLQTTQFYSTDLIGFGNDFFNEEFSLQIIYTTDGAAPLGETRDITDYVSADGHFTVGSVFSAAVNTGDKIAVLHKTQLLLIPTIDTSDPVDMTAEVPDNSVLAHVLTDDGDTSVYDRRRMSLEAITNALGIVNPAGTGFEGDGTGTTAYAAIVGVNEAVWMDGTAQQSLSDMPFVQGVLHAQQSPRVDQDSQIVATLSLHNLRPDSDVIQITEYSGTTITIARYRQGVDTDWTNIVVAAAMTEAAGQATYAYTFTSASWAVGDSIRYTVQSCVIEIPAVSGQIYTLPTTTSYGVALASSASSNALALPVFAEFWDTETIEPDVWTVTTPATGTLAINAAEAGYMKVRISPNANEIGRLVSDFRIRVAPDQVGINSIVKKLIVEFEAKFTTLANIDNAESFFGLSATTAATRTTNNLAAFTLTGDALFATTDDAAIENNAAAGAPTLTNWNKFRIEVYAGAIDFYVNEARTNNFVANLPDQMMYFNFYVDTEAGGAGTFDLGPVRYWYQDVL